ncbi:MAG TPA: hypothetical protein VIT23_04140 [Terrimicrobiaceae bacterium]
MVISSMLKWVQRFALSIFLGASVYAADDSFKAPDSLVLSNGRTVRGLIIKNTRDSVLLQQKLKEVSYPKKDIIRINDNADTRALFTDLNRKGKLPSWRVIANDLRTHDAIKSLVEIPATVIDNGVLKNIPYKSFRVNQDIELNIYGDPEDPAGIELGIYGPLSSKTQLRKTLRSYLAGFLTTREEIGALYSLDLDKGIAQAGDLTLEITPKDAPDAYGAWWVSLYNLKQLNQCWLSDADYARLVRPVNDVIDKRGRVISGGWSEKDAKLSKKLSKLGDSAKVLLRGFYRDKDGAFHLITEPEGEKSSAN